MTNQTCPARLPVPPVRVAPTPGRSACWADAPWTEALRSLGGWACGHGGHPAAVRWHHGWLGPDSQASGGTGSSLTGARLSTPAPTEPHLRACCGGVGHRGLEWLCSGTGDSVYVTGWEPGPHELAGQVPDRRQGAGRALARVLAKAPRGTGGTRAPGPTRPPAAVTWGGTGTSPGRGWVTGVLAPPVALSSALSTPSAQHPASCRPGGLATARCAGTVHRVTGASVTRLWGCKDMYAGPEVTET